MGQLNLTVISQAIVAAPYCRPDKLKALSVFQEFATDCLRPMPEMGMLAIDLVDPIASRLKIYFRIRETSFSSVQHTMTLGNRIETPELVRGLRNLKPLWDAVLERNGFPEDAALPQIDHRTAGILYNVEFHLGSAVPQVKIYIPVRHYAGSDQKIMHGLDEYQCHVNTQSNRRFVSVPAPLSLSLVIPSVAIEQSISDGNPVFCAVPGNQCVTAAAYILTLDAPSRLEDHYASFHTSILRGQSLRTLNRRIVVVGAEIDRL